MLGNMYMIGSLIAGIVNYFSGPQPVSLRDHGQSGFKHHPTLGEIWPEPASQKKSDNYLVLVPTDFKFKVIGKTCPILKRAILRYSRRIRNQYTKIYEHTKRNNITNETEFFEEEFKRLLKDDHFKGGIGELLINLKKSCSDYPYPNMNEQYHLSISMVSSLTSSSIWGILRGLESFTQSFYSTHELSGLQINITEIYDYPRFEHRGILLDTSKHFISVPNLLKTLEAMVMNKMNVFHWHLTDDASFSFESATFPNLSAKGSFSPKKVYTKTIIKNVIDFARDRGIRVIPGFSVPDHTQSWGLAYPEILTQCYGGDQQPNGLGPMNPTKTTTFHILSELFKEIRNTFPDPTIHLGGEDVDLSCWKSNDYVVGSLVRQKLYSEGAWYNYFMNRTLSLLSRYVTPIVWQDAVQYMSLPRHTIIHLDKGIHDDMVNIIAKGHRVLYSYKWNINEEPGTPLNSFEDMYLVEPRINLGKSESKRVIGGEVCIWTDLINDHNIISSTWPRASAVAEVLWSKSIRIFNPNLNELSNYVKRRLEEHNCRMKHQGIASTPAFGPDAC